MTERETLLSVQTAQDFIILLNARFEVSPDEVHFGLSGTVRAAILLFQHNFFGGEKGDPELPHIHSEILLHLTDGICSLFVEHFDLIDLNLYKMGQSQIDKKIARAP